jgi:type II secretory pathway component PulC
VVEHVEPAGWSSLAGLRQGDLLLSINQTDLQSVKNFKDIMFKVAENKPAHVTFFVKRGIHTLYIKVEPTWDPS